MSSTIPKAYNLTHKKLYEWLPLNWYELSNFNEGVQILI